MGPYKGHISPYWEWALVMGPLDSGGVCSMARAILRAKVWMVEQKQKDLTHDDF